MFSPLLCTAAVIMLTDFVASSRVDTQDTRQRTTRSQARLMAERHPSLTAKTSLAEGAKQNTVKSAAEKASSLNRGSSKLGTSRNSSTATAACQVTVRRSVSIAGSDGKSTRVAESTVNKSMTGVDVLADAGVEDIETSCDQTSQQSRRSRHSAVAQLSSKQLKSGRRSDYKRMENAEESKDGAGENMTKDETSAYEGSEASVFSAQQVPAEDNVLSHELCLDNGSASSVDMNEAKILPHVGDKGISCSAGGEGESQPEVLKSCRTPGQSRRTRSVASPSLTFASIRKTPQNLQNSLLLRRMSPEEGYVSCFRIL